LDADTVRAVRDRLRAELDVLDALGQRMAAIELDAAIQILNSELGEKPDEVEVQRLQRRFFSD
ncbi:MAG: hypothetical protein ACTHJU_04025, partial [Sphingopyxis sp.]